ncbi:MAG: hypothetical protein CMJ46_15490 [Planctomyces sp.]|nr:hypothetical protein [Planctomyces sp.]
MMKQESKRTAIYVGLACAALLVAIWAEAATKPEELKDFAKVGTEFYPEFKDPTAAASLTLYTFDEASATSPEFSVVFDDGAYRLPTYNNYPADAEERLAKTAASLIGIERDALAGRRKTDHKRYGVIAPRSDEETELEGRGSRITIKDAAGAVLVDYIIGNKVDGETDQYYVRLPEEKETYKVKLDIDLSTKFSDWVDQDLLKISQADLRKMELNRYSVDPQSGRLQPGEVSKLTRPDSSSDWELADFSSEEEQVSQSKVRTMASTLDSLELLGVRQKPEGINANVEINASLKDNQLMIQALAQDLSERGFYIAPNEDDELYLYADQGELALGTNNGLAYTLRFGDVFTGSLQEIEAGFLSSDDDKTSEEEEKAASEEDDSEKAEGEAAEKSAEEEAAEEESSSDSKQGRYLFISVNFDESLLGEPPVEPTKPEPPAEKTSTEKEAGEGQPAEETEASEETAVEKEPAATEEDTAEDGDGPALAERPASDEAPAEESESSEEEDAEGGMSEEEYQQALAEYEAALQQYKADLAEYNERKEQGRKTAATNNERFAGWYYVISEESFEKLKVPAEELVEPVGAEDAEDAGGASGGPGLPPGLNLPNFNLPQEN